MDLRDFFEIIKSSKTIPGGKYNTAIELFQNAEINYSEESIRAKIKGRRTQHCKETRINMIINEVGFVNYFEQRTSHSWQNLQAAFKKSQMAEFVDCDTNDRIKFYHSLLRLFYMLIQCIPIEFASNIPSAAIRYGRENEINQLNEILMSDKYNCAFISGISGIGKTTLALSYAHQLEEKGWKVQYIDCSDFNSFKECISNINFTSLENEGGADEIYQKTMNLLERIMGPVLIILDNCNHISNNDFVEINRKDIKFIIVSETCLSSNHNDIITLSPLDDDSLLKLYASFRLDDNKQCVPYIQKNRDNMLKLFKLVDNHTYAVILLAKLAENTLSSETEIYNIFSNTLCITTGNNIYYRESDSEHIKTIIRAIINLSSLSSEEKLIMSYMSLMPLSGVKGNLFLKLTGCEREKIVKLKRRNIIIDEEGFKIRLHPLVCDTILNIDDLVPTEEMVQKLLTKVSVFKDYVGRTANAHQSWEYSDEDLVSFSQIYMCIGSRIFFCKITNAYPELINRLKPEYKNALFKMNRIMIDCGNDDYSGIPFSKFKPMINDKKCVENDENDDDENN